MGGALANMLGMGVTVQLLDMFTSTSQQVSKSAKTLATDIEKTANHANNAWNGMFVGGALVTSGLGIIHTIANIGKKSIESSSQLEIFRNQFHVMIKDYQWAEKVYNDSINFAKQTPFTIPEVVGAAKTLRAFGFQAHQIGGELKIAGDWASMFSERIEKTSEILGRAMSGGYGRALNYMRGKGINDKDIQDMARQQGTYNELFDATGRTRRGYDGNKMVAAMTAVIKSRYPDEMITRMGTIPGMMSNLEDQMILLLAKTGDQFKPRLKNILTNILSSLNGEQMASLGKAVGMGFDVLLRVLGYIVLPLKEVVVWLGHLSEQHPNFMKWVTVAVSLAGALVFLTGTWLVWVASAKLWKMAGMVSEFETLKTTILSFITGPLGLLLVAAAVLYMAWKYNFGGMQDFLTKWWGYGKLVFQAVMEGFASITNGVVTFSTETYDALEKAGIAGWVIDFMAILYRLYVVVRGAALGLYHMGYVLSVLGGAVFTILYPIWKLIEYATILAGKLFGLADSTRANEWEGWGYILGWVVGLMFLGSAALRAWAVAQALWTAVTTTASIVGNVWAFSLLSMKFGLWATTAALFPATAGASAFAAALWANPITWIVAGVLALVIGVGLLIWKWKEINAWFKSTPGWLQAILVAAMPLVFLPMQIYNNWAKIKEFLAPLGEFFKGAWSHPLDWLMDKIAALTAFFLRTVLKISQFMPDWMKPGVLREFSNIDPDKINGQFVKNMMSNSMDAAKQARLNGSGFVGAAVAGLTNDANARLVDDARYKSGDRGPVIIKLDGREIARSVSMHQSQEAATGRTF